MLLNEILYKIVSELSENKNKPFKGNELAAFIRNQFPVAIQDILHKYSTDIDYKIVDKMGFTLHI